MNQQQGFIGNAINDIKNNQTVLQPIYNTSATIGIIYTFFLYSILYNNIYNDNISMGIFSYGISI